MLGEIWWEFQRRIHAITWLKLLRQGLLALWVISMMFVVVDWYGSCIQVRKAIQGWDRLGVNVLNFSRWSFVASLLLLRGLLVTLWWWTLYRLLVFCLFGFIEVFLVEIFIELHIALAHSLHRRLHQICRALQRWLSHCFFIPGFLWLLSCILRLLISHKVLKHLWYRRPSFLMHSWSSWWFISRPCWLFSSSSVFFSFIFWIFFLPRIHSLWFHLALLHPWSRPFLIKHTCFELF